MRIEGRVFQCFNATVTDPCSLGPGWREVNQLMYLSVCVCQATPSRSLSSWTVGPWRRCWTCSSTAPSACASRSDTETGQAQERKPTLPRNLVISIEFNH